MQSALPGSYSQCYNAARRDVAATQRVQLRHLVIARESPMQSLTARSLRKHDIEHAAVQLLQ